MRRLARFRSRRQRLTKLVRGASRDSGREAPSVPHEKNHDAGSRAQAAIFAQTQPAPSQRKAKPSVQEKC